MKLSVVADDDRLAEVALDIIVLYALITLFFTTLLFIAGRQQARSKKAIDRLTVLAERLTEQSSAAAQSVGPAISDEFRTAVDRLTAEVKWLRERSTDDAERTLSSAGAGEACNAAIELLTAKIDHLMDDRIGMPQQFAKLKAAIDTFNSRVEYLTTIVQRIPNAAELYSDETTSRRSVTFDAETQQDLRDLLKEFE